LRIRESSTDYELIFGNPTETTQNLFSIIVKKDNTNNLYIKNNYSDLDVNAPLWINRSTGEVNIKSLIVNSFDNKGTAGTTVNTGGGLFPTGGIMMFTVSGVPTGWLECDGSDISINDYGVLYNVIGQNYTTSTLIDKTTRFQIPDLRGEFVRGWDNNKGIDAGRSLGTFQAQDIQSHTHSVPAGGTIVNSINQRYSDNSGNVNSAGAQTTDSTGGTETRPRNIALIYCIKT
jgi:microcystin-dependent protein